MLIISTKQSSIGGEHPVLVYIICFDGDYRTLGVFIDDFQQHCVIA